MSTDIAKMYLQQWSSHYLKVCRQLGVLCCRTSYLGACKLELNFLDTLLVFSSLLSNSVEISSLWMGLTLLPLPHPTHTFMSDFFSPVRV